MPSENKLGHSGGVRAWMSLKDEQKKYLGNGGGGFDTTIVVIGGGFCLG